MLKSTKRTLVLLFLLLASLITANLMRVNSQSTTGQSSMVNGVLAHEMSSQEAQTLAKSNITWVSCDVTSNPLDDCEWTQIYSLAKQNNLSLLGILDWHLMNYSKTFQLSDWSNAVNQAVSEFGDVVKTWEIWNEPNFSWNSYGYYNGTAQQYVALMQTAYDLIKAAAPNDTVIGLGGVPLFTGAEPTTANTYASTSLYLDSKCSSIRRNEILRRNCCTCISLWRPQSNKPIRIPVFPSKLPTIMSRQTHLGYRSRPRIL